ncbi:MAG: hypothetical protein MHPDNHAH_00398 [Anaerolineales bacterium]|nr:hypothetical protein [Anaerolineales bacterium]WKZ47355.1 MAG: DUF2877 domain-containing protein [Anaerolineales bacterium]
MQIINALSFTENARQWLVNSNQPKILHVFDEVCNLINENKEILSIVHAGIGNGPFNLVVEDVVMFARSLDAESRVSIQEKGISLGDIEISLSHSQLWNPMPNWNELRNKKDEIANRLSLLPIEIEDESIHQFSDSLIGALITADAQAAKAAASKLAGLGIGLTPAGDDFLVGAMHAAWIIHPQDTAKKITEEIANIAAPLTTSLSGAWLKSAARGEAGELWHDLFDALLEDKNIYVPMSRILSVGETSGSDALRGFFGVFYSVRTMF